MKKLLTFIALTSLVVSQSFSQANVYHPFPLDGGEWRADYFSSYCAGLCEQRRYYTVGDTIIDSLKYKKLYVDIIPEIGNPVYAGYIGSLREDTINRKIFFFYWGSPQVDLLFDFNLDSGDVAPETYLHSENDTMIVVSVDSILIGNNFHKRFNLSTSNGYPASLIEGVGWSGGLILEPMSPLIGWEVTYNLKCLKVNGVLEYEDTSYTYPTCDLPLDIEQLALSEQNLIMYPNPVSIGSNLYFNLKERQKYKLKIFDITGKLIIETPFANNSFYVSPSVFHEGIYLFELSDNTSRRFLTKLILLKTK